MKASYRLTKKTRKYYKDLFDKLMEESGYKYKTDNRYKEKWVQCKCKYGRDYWFICNFGKVLSVQRGYLEEIKPTERNKNNRRWFYQIIKDGKCLNVTMEKIICDHFLRLPKADEEIHHIIPITKFEHKESYKANRISNLIILPKEKHKLIHKIYKAMEQKGNEPNPANARKLCLKIANLDMSTLKTNVDIIELL